MKQLLPALMLFLCCHPAKAIVRHAEKTGARGGGSSAPGGEQIPLNEFLKAKNKKSKKKRELPDFPYMDHVGMVGKGSGIYLGNGYVLTSAHVGCYPFRMGDGSHYKPVYSTWRVLRNADGGKSDLAVFRVKVDDASSSLAKLAPLPVGSVDQDLALQGEDETPMIMIGTGFVEKDVPAATAADDMLPGYQVQAKREMRWGINSEARLLDKPVATAGGLNTSCFVTSFDPSEAEAQAADGDSGGAMFAYNAELDQWELVGCIIAVSQKGARVTYGAQTYLGNLESYRTELAGVLDPVRNAPNSNLSVISRIAKTPEPLPPAS